MLPVAFKNLIMHLHDAQEIILFFFMLHSWKKMCLKQFSV